MKKTFNFQVLQYLNKVQYFSVFEWLSHFFKSRLELDCFAVSYSHSSKWHRLHVGSTLLFLVGGWEARAHSSSAGE